PWTAAPAAMAARPSTVAGAITTAATGSAALAELVETLLVRRMEISVPAGTSCAIASTGTSSRQARINASYRVEPINSLRYTYVVHSGRCDLMTRRPIPALTV